MLSAEFYIANLSNSHFLMCVCIDALFQQCECTLSLALMAPSTGEYLDFSLYKSVDVLQVSSLFLL